MKDEISQIQKKTNAVWVHLHDITRVSNSYRQQNSSCQELVEGGNEDNHGVLFMWYAVQCGMIKKSLKMDSDNGYTTIGMYLMVRAGVVTQQ